jgi:hypothetical protein
MAAWEDFVSGKKLTQKTQVILRLFRMREEQGLIEAPITLGDVSAAIDQQNAELGSRVLSPHNPANFFKDVCRTYEGFEKAWPPEVLTKGYTGQQLTGGGSAKSSTRCFRFYKLPEGEVAAVVRLYPKYSDGTLEAFKRAGKYSVVETASLPLLTRRLGQKDESWINRVVVEQRIVHTYLAAHATFPKRFTSVLHAFEHLKRNRAEIDSLFYGRLDEVLRPLKKDEALQASGADVVIPCEIKNNEDIFASQIGPQVVAASKALGTSPEWVLPLAIKAWSTSLLLVVEFEALKRTSIATDLASLHATNLHVFQLVPPIAGIGRSAKTKRAQSVVKNVRKRKEKQEPTVKDEDALPLVEGGLEVH